MIRPAGARDRAVVAVALAVALAVVLSPARGFAQVQSGGVPMQDPRQMNGIPRPDEQVPGGTLTVRVIRGEFSVAAPEGHPVHLVGLSSDGKVSLQTQSVSGPEGRVTFSNLDRGGRVAYYALTSLDGDRLESQVIQLPPEVGVRVMLVTRKLGPTGAPEGEPIDDRMGGDGEVPAGEVWVSISGRPPRQAELHRVVAAGTERVAQAPAQEMEGDEGSFAAKLVHAPTDFTGVYLVSMEIEGKRVYSTPFMLKPDAGTGAFLFGYPGVFFSIHGAAELDDDLYWFETQLRILNPHATPFDAGPDGFLMPLPAGFRNARVREEHLTTLTKMVPDSGIVWIGPLPPGRLSITVQFALDTREGAVDLKWPMPHGTMDGTLILAHYPDMVVTAVAGAQTRQVPLGTGRLYDVVSGINRKVGESVELQITGLPQHPKSQQRARLAVGALVLIVLGFTLFTAISGRAPVRAESVAAEENPAERRESLDAEKERLYAELVALEKRRRDDAVEEDEYRRERTGVVSRLVLVHRELDELRAVEKVAPRKRS